MTTWATTTRSGTIAEVDFVFSDGSDFLFSDGLTDYVFLEAASTPWVDANKSSAATWATTNKDSTSWANVNKS